MMVKDIQKGQRRTLLSMYVCTTLTLVALGQCAWMPVVHQNPQNPYIWATRPDNERPSSSVKEAEETKKKKVKRIRVKLRIDAKVLVSPWPLTPDACRSSTAWMMEHRVYSACN